MPFKKKKDRIECVYIVGRMEPIPHKYQDDYIKVWKNIIFLGRTSSGRKWDIHDITFVQSVGLNW